MKALLFLACIGVVIWGVATWTGATASHAGAADKARTHDVDLPKGDPLDDAIQKRFGKADRVTGSGRVLRYDLQNGDTLIVSGGGHEFRHYDLQNGDALTLIVSSGDVIGVMHDRKKKDLSKGDLGDAMQKRFGKPDRVTGSGRGFLHYDLQNGGTLTLVVSGGDVIGVMHEKKTKK